MSGASPYGLVWDGAVWLEGERIRWVGAMADIPDAARHEERIDLEGRLVTPGLVDCHTHIVHGGDRADEFEMRLNGASYEALAKAGGGIMSTVRATRAASTESLVASALQRVDHLIAEGVTTIEIKSGYGLDVETELKMLRVARQISELRSVTVKTSFLGAHALPDSYKNNADLYLDEVCLPALEAAYEEGLVDVVDGFCEGIAFTQQQIHRVFEKAAALGLPVKLHAEQLSNLGGTQLATKFNALSSDHLEHATEDDVVAMANAGTLAVILPGAFYFLRETRIPPIDLFRKHRVPMALATDCNPGSSPVTSILLMLNMACTLFRLTPEEALAGVTCHGAQALGLMQCGRLQEDGLADLAIWDAQHPAELSYKVGYNPLYKRIYRGKV